MISALGLVIIVGMLWGGQVNYRRLWRSNPVETLALCGILGVLFGLTLVDAWYWVPAAYVPDQAMIERIKGVECHYPRCEEVVNDLLGRIEHK